MNNKIIMSVITIMMIITCFSGCVSNDEADTTDSNILKTFIVTEGKESSWSINDGALQMDFPKSAVKGEVAITVKTVPDGDDSDAYIPNTLYSFGPDGIQFNQMVNLSISYNPNDLPDGASEENIKIGKLVDGKWYLINGSVDTTNNCAWAHIWSFSEYGTVCQDIFKHGGNWDFMQGPSDVSPFDMDDVTSPEEYYDDSEEDSGETHITDDIIHLDSLIFRHEAGSEFGTWTKVSGDWYNVNLGGNAKMSDYFACNCTKFQYDSLIYDGEYSDVDFLVSTDLDAGASISMVIRGQQEPMNGIGNWDSYYKLTASYNYGQYSLAFYKKIGDNVTKLWEDTGFTPDSIPTSTEHDEAYRIVMQGEDIYIYYSYFDPYHTDRDYEELLWSGSDSDLESGSVGILAHSTRSDVRYKLFWAELKT